MSQKERSNRDYLLWTLLTMFAIIGVVGIYRGNQSAQQLDHANAEISALEASLLLDSDPNQAYFKARKAYLQDSANAHAQEALFQLFFDAAQHPFYEEIARFPGASAAACSPSGRYWGIVEGDELRLFDQKELKEERVSFPAEVLAIALSNSGDTWAVVDAAQHLHLNIGGLRHTRQLDGASASYLLQFSPGMRYLAVLSGESASLMDIPALEWVSMDRLPLGVQHMQGAEAWIAFDRADKYMAYCLRERDIYVVELPSGRTKVYPLEAWDESGAFSSQGRFVSEGAEDLPTRLRLFPNFPLPVLEIDLQRQETSLSTGPPAFPSGEKPAYLSGALESSTWEGRHSAIDSRGSLRRWNDSEYLYVVHFPKTLEWCYTAPFFEGQEVVYTDYEGVEYRYELLKGLLGSTEDSTRRQLSQLDSPDTKVQRAQWLDARDSSLQALPAFAYLMENKGNFGPEIPWGAENGPFEQVFLPAPDGRSLLVAYREEGTGRFANQFAWMPMTAAEIIRLLDGGAAGQLDPAGGA